LRGISLYYEGELLANLQEKKEDILSQSIYMGEIYGDSQSKLQKRLVKKEQES
jgi:hypothetical protein